VLKIMQLTIAALLRVLGAVHVFCGICEAFVIIFSELSKWSMILPLVAAPEGHGADGADAMAQWDDDHD
jgi:hypothetical protein